MATAVTEGAGGRGAKGEGKEKRTSGNRSSNPNPRPTTTATSALSNDGVRLAKPNKEDLDKLSNEIQSQISLLQNESKDIKKQIDKLLGAKNGAKSELDIARSALQVLINERKQLIDEKTTLSTARDAARDKINARINEEKNARSELKFNNLASIESQIRELEARQARTTMSLQDEKKILKDIHQLQMSKKTVATLADMKAAIELLKQQKIEIDRNFNEKSGQVKNVNERITAQRAVLEGLTKDNSEQREALPGLRSRQNEIKKVVDDKYQEIKTLRQEFKAKEEAFYLALAEERQRKKEQKQKEIEAKKAADEARRKAEEEEELKRIPYEDEMNLCDYLVSYLETLLPSTAASPSSAEVISASASGNASSSSFDGMKVLVRKEEEYSTVAVQKKKGKKKSGNSHRDIISHGVDTLESFSLLDIAPPSSVTNVPTAIEALRAKKATYQGLERGAVETLASKQRAEREKKSAEESKKKPKGASVFNLEQDFPDLAIATPATETP